MDSLSVSPSERQAYQQHFLNAGPVNGKLPGAAARENLLQSGLATNQLGEIWELADIDKDGALDLDEYCIALKLVFSLLNRVISSVPPVLPPSLIPDSKYRHFTTGGGAGAISPAHAASPQFSAQQQQALSPGSAGTPGQQRQPPAGGATLEWFISGADRARYQGLFAQHSRGSPTVRLLDVDELLGTMGVPRSVVTQAWALVDVRKYQQLNQEQFTYLLHMLGSCARGAQLPAVLPAAVKDAIYGSLSLGGGGGSSGGGSPAHGYRHGKSSTPTDPRNPGLYGERSGNVALADSYLSKLKTSSTFKNEAGSRYASSGKRAEEEKQLRAELKELDEQAERLQAEYDRLGRAPRDGDDATGTAVRELEELKAYKEREKQAAQQAAGIGGGGASESLQDIKQAVFQLEGHLAFLQSGKRAMDEFMAKGRQELLDLQLDRVKI